MSQPPGRSFRSADGWRHDLIEQRMSRLARPENDAARLPDQADNGVRSGPLSTRGTSGVVVNLLADFEGVDWSFHATV